MLKRLLSIVLLTLSISLTGAQAQDSTDAESVLRLVNADGETLSSMTMAQLEALPAFNFTTTTVWTEGDNEFTGPSLQSVFEALGVTADTVKLVALNDYAIDLTVSDIQGDYPIVAHKRNGENMSVRSKGPLWVVYPYDLDETFRTETAYSRSIWQLVKIAEVAD